MASPVHPAPTPIPAQDGEDAEEVDDDASVYSANSAAQDEIEVGLAEGTVGALLSLDRGEAEDFMDVLGELCELSASLGDPKEAFRRRARDYIKASVA